MNHSENKEKYILLNNLFNLYLDSSYDEEDEALLKEEGVDIEATVQKNMMLFRQLRTKTKAELNEKKYNRVKEFLSDLREGISSGVEKYKQIADEITSKPKFAELQPMFKNLKEVSEKDKLGIMIDSKLLDMLGEMEEQYNKENQNE